MKAFCEISPNLYMQLDIKKIVLTVNYCRIEQYCRIIKL